MSIPERRSCSQAMGRGSPLCEQLPEQIVLQFKNNISQCTVARNWGISSSTVHIVIKNFRESGEISACKQQGQKPTLNARDLWSLRQHCIKNQHHSATLAQEHFGKPLSVNTVYKCQLKLYNAKRKPYINNIQKCHRPELIWDGLRQSGKVCCGLTSPHFKLFLEIMDMVSSGPKRKRTIQTLSAQSSKANICDGIGVC